MTALDLDRLAEVAYTATQRDRWAHERDGIYFHNGPDIDGATILALIAEARKVPGLEEQRDILRQTLGYLEQTVPEHRDYIRKVLIATCPAT